VEGRVATLRSEHRSNVGLPRRTSRTGSLVGRGCPDRREGDVRQGMRRDPAALPPPDGSPAASPMTARQSRRREEEPARLRETTLGTRPVTPKTAATTARPASEDSASSSAPSSASTPTVSDRRDRDAAPLHSATTM
jgi:hypothetical protein